MKIELTEIIELTEAKTVGKTDFAITGVSKVDDAEPGSLSFIYDKAYEKFQEHTRAAAILVSPDINKLRDDITYLVVDKPREQFNKVLLKYFQPEFPLEGIDESASIHPGAALGNSTAVGKNVVIGDGVKIGDNCKIFHNSVIGENVTIGNNSIIFHNVIIREDSRIGKRVIIHSGAVIGADGFGFVPDKEGRYIKIPQIGNVILEDDVEIGANTCIDRAALGTTLIKQGVKIDNLVQIAHNVKVGENTVFSGQAGVSGSTVIGRNCIIAGQVGLADHIEIGDGVILTARTGVPKSIPKKGVYAGAPARNARDAWRIEAHLSNIKDYADRIKALEKKIKKLEEKNSGNKESDV